MERRQHFDIPLARFTSQHNILLIPNQHSQTITSTQNIANQLTSGITSAASGIFHPQFLETPIGEPGDAIPISAAHDIIHSLNSQISILTETLRSAGPAQMCPQAYCAGTTYMNEDSHIPLSSQDSPELPNVALGRVNPYPNTKRSNPKSLTPPASALVLVPPSRKVKEVNLSKKKLLTFSTAGKTSSSTVLSTAPVITMVSGSTTTQTSSVSTVHLQPISTTSSPGLSSVTELISTPTTSDFLDISKTCSHTLVTKTQMVASTQTPTSSPSGFSSATQPLSEGISSSQFETLREGMSVLAQQIALLGELVQSLHRVESVEPEIYKYEDSPVLEEFFVVFEKYCSGEHPGAQDKWLQLLEKYLDGKFLRLYAIHRKTMTTYQDMKSTLLQWFRDEENQKFNNRLQEYHTATRKDGENEGKYAIRLELLACQALSAVNLMEQNSIHQLLRRSLSHQVIRSGENVPHHEGESPQKVTWRTISFPEEVDRDILATRRQNSEQETSSPESETTELDSGITSDPRNRSTITKNVEQRSSVSGDESDQPAPQAPRSPDTMMAAPQNECSWRRDACGFYRPPLRSCAKQPKDAFLFNEGLAYCMFCGKTGHVINECYRFNRFCSYCKKSGHTRDECWLIPLSPSKHNIDKTRLTRSSCPFCEGPHLGKNCTRRMLPFPSGYRTISKNNRPFLPWSSSPKYSKKGFSIPYMTKNYPFPKRDLLISSQIDKETLGTPTNKDNTDSLHSLTRETGNNDCELGGEPDDENINNSVDMVSYKGGENCTSPCDKPISSDKEILNNKLPSLLSESHQTQHLTPTPVTRLSDPGAPGSLLSILPSLSLSSSGNNDLGASGNDPGMEVIASTNNSVTDPQTSFSQIQNVVSEVRKRKKKRKRKRSAEVSGPHPEDPMNLQETLGTEFPLTQTPLTSHVSPNVELLLHTSQSTQHPY